jgi:invasion protein IalB
MARRSTVIILIATALAAASGWASAQAQAPAKKKPTAQVPAGAKAPKAAAQKGPDMTSETYGDWVLQCRGSGAKTCEVAQTLVLQGQQRPIAMVAFGREKKGDPMRIVVQVPTNITFNGGVRALTADGSILAAMVYRRCFPTGCFADAPLNGTAISKLKTQTSPGSIKFKDGTEREISLPLSLKGLGSAIDALNRS